MDQSHERSAAITYKLSFRFHLPGNEDRVGSRHDLTTTPQRKIE